MADCSTNENISLLTSKKSEINENNPFAIREKSEEHEFSEGFLHDLAYLLERCKEGNTDSITLTFNMGEHTLTADMVFAVVQKEG